MDTVSTAVKSPEILYRLRDADGALLYVGITRDWPTRMKQHQADKPWWSDVRGMELVFVDGTRPQIEAIEKAVIKAEAPRHNVVHNGEVRRTLAAPVADPVAEFEPPVEAGDTITHPKFGWGRVMDSRPAEHGDRLLQIYFADHGFKWMSADWAPLKVINR